MIGNGLWSRLRGEVGRMANGIMRFLSGSRWAFFASLLLTVTLIRAALAFVIGVILTWVALALSPLGQRAQNDPLLGILIWVGGFAGVALVFFWTWEGLRRKSSDAHGSASFATDKQVRTLLPTNSTGLLVGRALRKPWPMLRYDGEAHLITIAPTRSGKGVGTIIPNLLTANRAILCVDPKGENARITAAIRQGFGPVHVLDPFGVSGLPSSAFNPMNAIDARSMDVAEDAATLADALVADPPHQVQDAHWNEEAKALLTGLILLVATNDDPTRRTLNHLRELITLPPDAFYDLLQAMQANEAANGLIARAANRHMSKSEREAAGVLSSAQRHTHFLDSPRMTAVMARSEFSFADLKHEAVTVYLVLPPDRLDAYARWLRLIIAQALTTIARTPTPATDAPLAPILFLLDEFAALGRLEAVERAFGLMAGYGIQLWPILQDIHQLRAAYGARSGTFLSNAGLIQIFNVNDTDTAEWVSRALGDMTEIYETDSRSTSWPNQIGQPTNRSEGTATHLTRRALLTPDEVRRMESDLAILFKAGAAPVMAQKLRYFADPEFQTIIQAETPAKIAATE
jgi:type IV secretion system protein VirD4